MSDIAQIDLNIRKGETFGKALQWGQAEPSYAAITGVLKRAPVRITAPNHGVPDAWFVAIDSLPGIRGLDMNAMWPVNVIDEHTIELIGLTGARLRGEYTDGGYLRFSPPVDMTGYTARMDIREYPEADKPIMTRTTENGGIVIDHEKAAVAMLFEAEDTADLPYRAGVYDLEMVAPGGQVHVLCAGRVRLTDEVTRDDGHA